MSVVLSLSNQMKSISALVVGDVMLDRYVFGEASRVSPEAPVLILEAGEIENRPGGATGVAKFLSVLGVDVSLAGVVGCDEPGDSLVRLLTDANIDCRFVMPDPDRKTTLKERFLGGHPQRQPCQMLRVDHETRSPLPDSLAGAILERILSTAESCDVILLVDYAKGVCTEFLVQELIGVGRRNGIPVLVDPGRGVPLNRYRGAWLLKPNRTEASEMAGQKIMSAKQALEAAAAIMSACDIENLVITLDSDGSVLATREGIQQHLPTQARQVADITGAGDMFLAALSLAVGNRIELFDALLIANSAAGLEVEMIGSAAISPQDLQDSLARCSPCEVSKLIRREALAGLRDNCRRAGKRIVFTNGCFDLLHSGHVRCLEEARMMGDVLVVGLNSDTGITRLKGNNRPIISQDDRIRMLSALSCVSFVVLFGEDTPCPLLKLLQPDVLVKGGTYSTDEVVGRDIVEHYGGRVEVVSMTPGISTSALISRILDREMSHVAADNH